MSGDDPTSRDPFREGQWVIRQLKAGQPTGGGTVNMGWRTREDAEAANPPRDPYTYEVFDRFPAATTG